MFFNISPSVSTIKISSLSSVKAADHLSKSDFQNSNYLEEAASRGNKDTKKNNYSWIPLFNIVKNQCYIHLEHFQLIKADH